MDPLSATASAASVAHVLHNIYRYGHAVYKSKAEQRQLKGVFERLDEKLNRLKTQETKALKHPDDPMYQGFLAVLKSSEPIKDDENVMCDPTGRKPGALQQLQTDMEKMEAKLVSKSGCRARSRRLLWYHERKKFQEMIDEFNDWTAAVDSILIPDVIIDTNERVRVIDDKVDDAARDRERMNLEKKRKALEKRRKDIVAWLSPLRFRERQSGLLIGVQANLSNPSLLAFEEFELWKAGRPWILHCQGKPGAGKVCICFNCKDATEPHTQSISNIILMQTILCATVVRHLAEVFAKHDIPILCMYINHKERGRQSLDNLIASLLKQLIQREGAEFRSPEAKRLYQGAENEGRPDENTFFDALCAEIQCYER